MSTPRHLKVLAAIGFAWLLGGIVLASEDESASAWLAGASASSADLTSLPIGDGRVTYSGARRGYVYACQNGGGPAGGPPGGGPPGGPGGAQVEGPWIKDDGTFDRTAKPTVDGTVSWPNAWKKIKLTKKRRVIAGNGLPVGHSTGEFPISASDDAYRYDRNPNSIGSHRRRSSLPRRAKRKRRASCLPMGAIGVAKNGVAIYNALDALQRDAVAHEVQDRCDGHPQQQGEYHYHSIPDCLTGKESTGKASGLVGYALDGFPIYGPRGAKGRLLTNKDLDACHGKVGKVYFEGRWQRIYHYVATYEYPYTLGCFRGTPVS